MTSTDRTSPVPLYHQIANEIRLAIAQGRLAPGDRLEPLRQAAERLGVHHHTVRHAYAELARDGLIRSDGPRGTRVTRRAVAWAKAAPEPLEAFVQQCLRQARDLHNIEPAELSQLILAAASPTNPAVPNVHVAECSLAQAADLSRQLMAVWSINARPLVLSQTKDLPDETVVGTYFHYNEFRTRWPQRLSYIQFVSIRPDPAIASRLDRLRSDAKKLRITLCEYDEPTALAVAADLSGVLDPQRFSIRTHILSRRGSPGPGDGAWPRVYTPRVWSGLSASDQRSPAAIQLRYIFDPKELNELGCKFDWRRSINSIEQENI